MSFQYPTNVDDEISFDVCTNDEVIINRREPMYDTLEDSIAMSKQSAIDLAHKLLEELGG